VWQGLWPCLNRAERGRGAALDGLRPSMTMALIFNQGADLLRGNYRGLKGG
jgi:hypothetical protein